MKRRDLLTLVGSAAVAWPLAARAQHAAARVIGMLFAGSQEADEVRLLPGFVRGLSDEGLTVGRNVTIESRWARGNYERCPKIVGLVLITGSHLVQGEQLRGRRLVSSKGVEALPMKLRIGDRPALLAHTRLAERWAFLE
jgi:putative ABC transport system substrate-binding protein